MHGPLFIASWADSSFENRRVQREGPEEPAAIRPDYDSNPKRWASWQPRHDVHEIVARELSGPTLDVGCGDGRLASLLRDDVSCIGVHSSPTQLASNPHRPVVLADMRQLPFRDGMFAEVTHLWCLYHVADPPHHHPRGLARPASGRSVLCMHRGPHQRSRAHVGGIPTHAVRRRRGRSRRIVRVRAR